MSALQILKAVQRSLTRSGFDIAIPFVVRELEKRLAADAAAGKEARFSFGLDPSVEAIGVLVANSRALWPVFQPTLSTSPAGPEHPLDAYTERVVHDAVLGQKSARVFFGHGPTGYAFPIQRIAHHTGVLPHSPGRLNVHPTFGPWIGLRSVIVLPGLSLPPKLAPAPSEVCRGCSAPCHDALVRAVADTPSSPSAEFARLRLSERAKLFLAVRTVCPVGQAERYPDQQIEFHYRALL